MTMITIPPPPTTTLSLPYIIKCMLLISSGIAVMLSLLSMQRILPPSTITTTTTATTPTSMDEYNHYHHHHHHHHHHLLRGGVDTHHHQQQQQQLPPQLSTSNTVMHILFCGHGNHTGFLTELQASLKSVLLNAPLDYSLEIHYLLDSEAQISIRHLFEQDIRLQEWKMRQPVTIRTYNVEKYISQWIHIINTTYRYFPHDMNRFRHTPGAYFRLFANHVLVSNNNNTIKNVLYMDSDVVIMSNLGRLWNDIHIDNNNDTYNNNNNNSSEYIFQWGEEKCSGFMILNLLKLQQLWNLLQINPLVTLQLNYTLKEAQKITHQKKLGDQYLLRATSIIHPELVGYLPPEWDVSANDGPWWTNRTDGEETRGTGLLKERSNGVGMLHFNGGGSNHETSVFDSHPFLIGRKKTIQNATNYDDDINNNNDTITNDSINDTTRTTSDGFNHDKNNNTIIQIVREDNFDSTWKLVHYYNNIGWKWTKFMVESQIGYTNNGGKGYSITIVHIQ